MSERNYWVICDDGCKFPALTREQVLSAIAEATGNTVSDCDNAFITKIRESNAQGNLTFWVGTQAEYNAITNKEPYCFYIVTDETTGEDIALAISELRAAIDETQGNVRTLQEKEAERNKVLWVGMVTADANNNAKRVSFAVPNIQNYNIIEIDGATYHRDTASKSFSYVGSGRTRFSPDGIEAYEAFGLDIRKVWYDDDDNVTIRAYDEYNGYDRVCSGAKYVYWLDTEIGDADKCTVYLDETFSVRKIVGIC